MAGSFDFQSVEPLLRTRWLGRPCHFFDRLSSSNTRAAKMARDGAAHGAAVVADSQTGGRGRLGRQWHSPPGLNLHLSLVLRPRLEPAQAPPLSLAAAVGVAHGLQPFLGDPPTVKWPNDLLVGGRKICGILVEMSAEMGSIKQIILGVGVNINATSFPQELQGRATSIRLESGEVVSRSAVLASVLNNIEPWIETLQAGPGDIIAAWLKLAPWIGEPITVTLPAGGATVRGVALGLDHTGALRLGLRDGKEEAIVAGEMEV